MAVLPEFQNQGIGSALVRRGLEVLRARGESVVMVLGHSEFYPRFGFRPARESNVACPYDIPPEAWMLLELTPGVLARTSHGQSAVVVYPRAFEQI
jgi:putative acetyltransferase